MEGNSPKSLFAAADDVLNLFLQTIEQTNSERIQKHFTHCPWQGDQRLQESIGDYKEKSDILTNTCNKLSLMKLSSMPTEGLKSIIDETLGGANLLIECFIRIVDNEVSPLTLQLYFGSTKSLLMHVKDLMAAIISKDFETSKMTIGLVWKDNDIIKKLPLANKGSFRRALMEILITIKDTYREFDEALVLTKQALESNESKSGAASYMNTDEDDEDGMFDDMDESDTYDSLEVPYVEASIQLLKHCYNVIKVNLDFISFYSETVNVDGLIGDSNVIIDETSDIRQKLNKLPYEIYESCFQLKTTIVDFGCELYSPVDVKKVKYFYNNVNDILNDLLLNKTKTIANILNQHDSSSNLMLSQNGIVNNIITQHEAIVMSGNIIFLNITNIEDDV